MNNGHFIISLDFELLWGVRDKKNAETYGDNLRGVWQAIPAMLETFKRHQVITTFASVGFLFLKDKHAWNNSVPHITPTYSNNALNPYSEEAIQEVSEDEPGIFHFAPSLIHKIRSEGHEIATHTFSHYYCLEEGQTPEQFRADLQAAKLAASKLGIQVSSIVFPRNQYSDPYLKVCVDEKIYNYRGNPRSWIYEAKSGADETLIRRLLRLADTYIDISGHHCHDQMVTNDANLKNIPASRFLRPWSDKLQLLEPLRLRRIKNSMTYAAKHNLMYHLWWHPHNFGMNIKENINFLEQILVHYDKLSSKYSFESVTMQGYSEKLK